MAYSLEACIGMDEAASWAPQIRMPSKSRVRPGSEPSTLPPVSAARSTTTEPGAIWATMSAVTNIGARRPGTAAVVMSTSEEAMNGASSSRWRAARSSVISRA